MKNKIFSHTQFAVILNNEINSTLSFNLQQTTHSLSICDVSDVGIFIFRNFCSAEVDKFGKAHIEPGENQSSI